MPAGRRYTDYRDLLAREDVDAVDICTPNQVRLEPLLAASRGGQARAGAEADGPQHRRSEPDDRRRPRGGGQAGRVLHGSLRSGPRSGAAPDGFGRHRAGHRPARAHRPRRGPAPPGAVLAALVRERRRLLEPAQHPHRRPLPHARRAGSVRLRAGQDPGQPDDRGRQLLRHPGVRLGRPGDDGILLPHDPGGRPARGLRRPGGRSAPRAPPAPTACSPWTATRSPGPSTSTA